MSASTRARSAQTRAEPEPAPPAAARAALFRELYDRHAAALVRRLAHAAGDPEVARDLAQEAFATAHARLDGFRGDAEIATWLYAIAFNHLRDHRKRRRRWWAFWARKVDEPTPAELSPEQAVAARDELSRLRAAVRELPPHLRDAYVLRVIEEVPLAQAAEILGSRPATVSYRAKRAEAVVRQRFAATEDDGEDAR